ncbi:MAG: peptide ABC transporter substrate-binding protein [Chloroflexi bacterium]|nr:peptide ABC transporter substrate-binding protein [Chloroflexota bacterium]
MPPALARRLPSLALIAGLALLAALWLLAGGDAASSGPGAGADGATTDAAARGTYVEGVLGRPAHPTPLFARPDEVDADLAALLFSGLTRIAPDGTPLPDLAARWEVTPDALTYTFHLRGGLAWHDGAPLTAADIAFTVATVQAAGFQGPSTLAARWAAIQVTAADKRTVVIRLPAPAAGFLTQAALGILPRHLLGGLSPGQLLDDPFQRAPVGSGPFRLVALDGARALLEANPSYHLGAPQLRRLELRFYADAPALAHALEDREVDGALLTGASVPPAVAAARPDLRASTLVTATSLVLYCNTQRLPLANLGLRRALAASLDRAALAAMSGALPGDGPIVPGAWPHHTAAWPAAAEAGALFDAASWPRRKDGTRARNGEALRLQLLTNANADRVALATAIATQLEAQGVAAHLTVLPGGELLRDRIAPRDFDLLLFAWDHGADPDPYPAWHTSQIGAGGRNVAGFHDPDSDALLEAARLTLDQSERRELYARFSDRFAQLAPAVVLTHPRRAYVRPYALEAPDPGLLYQPSSRFWDVQRWQLAP